MGYLLPAEYAEFGLTAETADAWVTTASAMMEAYCRRPSLLVASYTDRMRVPRVAQTVRLSYGPLVSVDAVKARYALVRPEELLPMQQEFVEANDRSPPHHHQSKNRAPPSPAFIHYSLLTIHCSYRSTST